MKARIVAAYDKRLVGMIITPSYIGESRAVSVREDGYQVVQAPELASLNLGDSTSYTFGAYCRIEEVEQSRSRVPTPDEECE